MAGARITITGAKELQRKLDALPRKTASKIERKGLRNAAKIVLAEAKRQVPVDTGFLRSKIKVRVGKRRKDRISINVQVGAGDFKGKSFYGGPVHYGHRVGKRTAGMRRAQRKGGIVGDTRKAIPATPFMTGAFELKKQEATEAIITSIREGIREATGAA